MSAIVDYAETFDSALLLRAACDGVMETSPVDLRSARIRRTLHWKSLEFSMQHFSLAFVATAALLLVACAPQEAALPSSDVAEPAATDSAATATVVQAAVASPDHTTLVAAVQAAGLVETLSGPGPFTVFAPTNAAFAKLPAGAVESLTQPANRTALTNILTYHVVAGRVSAADLSAQIDAGGGSATVTSVQGGTLTARRSGQSIQLTDASGATSIVTAADVAAANGVVHVIDAVLTPPAS